MDTQFQIAELTDQLRRCQELDRRRLEEIAVMQRENQAVRRTLRGKELLVERLLAQLEQTKALA